MNFTQCLRGPRGGRVVISADDKPMGPSRVMLSLTPDGHPPIRHARLHVAARTVVRGRGRTLEVLEAQAWGILLLEEGRLAGWIEPPVHDSRSAAVAGWTEREAS